MEVCDHETGAWHTVDSLPSPSGEGHIVSGLSAGHTYSFRVDGQNHSTHAFPSVTIPHETRWQQEQFERRYQELHVIARGRTSVVKQAQDRGTGLQVALKEVVRRKIPQLITRAEYNYLTTLNHSSIVRGFAIFENAPSPGQDTIVMELVGGKDVLSHACSLSIIPEAHIRHVTHQLISALDYLQLRRIVHCDIKPDNLLIEEHGNQFLLKIVDFGSACTMSESNTSEFKRCLSPDLEFTAPELLTEPPSVSLTSDVWSCAVLVYVLISGVSPFLDDSPEETTANVMKADFSFLSELFPPDSSGVQEFISSLLVRDPTTRPPAHSVLGLPWLQLEKSDFDVFPSRLASFINRRTPHRLNKDFSI